MDKVLKIASLKDSENSYDYWQTKSPEERLHAVFVLRNRIYDIIPEYKDHGRRLQRVFKITTRK